VIHNTGADGLEISMYVRGVAGALPRGYNCLILNGPGQCDSLVGEEAIHYPAGLGEAITPVVDADARAAATIDPLMRIARGGRQPGRLLCAARAGLRAPAIAAGVAG